MSNVTRSGYLTFPEFALAMSLTNKSIKGESVPSSVPENVRNEVLGVIEQIKVIEQQRDHQHQQQQNHNVNQMPQMIQQPTGFLGVNQLTPMATGLVAQPTRLSPMNTGLMPMTTGSTPMASGLTSGLTTMATGMNSLSGQAMPGMMAMALQMMPQRNPPQQFSAPNLQGQATIPWAVTPEEKLQYQEIFRAWDTQGIGYLTGIYFTCS
jgi:hypothetical protein